LVVADTHGQEILEALVCLQGHKERGYIFKDLGAGFERVKNNFSDGTRDGLKPRESFINRLPCRPLCARLDKESVGVYLMYKNEVVQG
jgi:hypothetical protein